METTEKHAGGRPPIYDGNNEDDVLKVQHLCEEYFKHIQGEYEAIVNPDDETDITYKTVREPERPSVTGLTLHIGFESKSTLYDYASKPQFSHSIKRALTKIEQYHELKVGEGDKCTGNIFILKNLGWHDTVKTDVTTGGEKINASPTIVFKKFDNE